MLLEYIILGYICYNRFDRLTLRLTQQITSTQLFIENKTCTVALRSISINNLFHYLLRLSKTKRKDVWFSPFYFTMLNASTFGKAKLQRIIPRLKTYKLCILCKRYIFIIFFWKAIQHNGIWILSFNIVAYNNNALTQITVNLNRCNKEIISNTSLPSHRNDSVFHWICSISTTNQ